MFTGIVEEIGQIRAIERGERRARLTVACRQVLEDASTGASIAVDGCCLTVADLGDGTFEADLMAETLRATALGDLREGARVNLERPLAADGRFGGHVVQGHVDGVGTVVGRDAEPGTVFLTVEAPSVAGELVPKGSVAVQGVSLTVVDVEADAFRVGLIPHTCEVTTLGDLEPGDRVNLEADILGKYVHRYVTDIVRAELGRHGEGGDQ